MTALLLTVVAVSSIITASAAGASMYSGNEEWNVITASALGGVFGSVVGVFFTIFAKPSEWKWHIFGIRWAVNICSSTVLGPLAYWYFHRKYFIPDEPSPILAIACGGIIGALFILMFQPLIPWFQRLLQSRLDKFNQDRL